MIGHTPKDRVMSVIKDQKIYSPNEHAKILFAGLINAPKDVAHFFNIEHGNSVIRRHRITYMGETPISMSTSWFDAELAKSCPKLLEVERIEQGTFGYIAQQTGRLVHHGRDQISALDANQGEAEALDVEIGTPLVFGMNWLWDEDSKLIEFGEYASKLPQTYDYEVGK